MFTKITKHLALLTLISVIILAFGLAVAADDPKFTPAPEKVQQVGVESFDKDRVSIIVDLEVEPVASYAGGVNGFEATSPNVTGRKLDVTAQSVQAYRAYVRQQLQNFKSTALQAVPSAKIIHEYDVVIGGVSMIVPTDQVDAIAKLPGVKRVYPDSRRYALTDVSNEFIGSPTIWEDLGGQESAGEGVVVGVVDSGIWPEHPSFSDPDPSGKAYAEPPATWKGDHCDFDEGGTITGTITIPFECNNKLIGAFSSVDTYIALSGLPEGEFASARDADGHGTHTTSTAAGNAGVQATLLGVERGIISGVAPRAHVAMYKGLLLGSGYSSDLVRAINQAVEDGVDVINYSIGGGSTDPYEDADALAFLDAYAAGIFVATSAGNDGPDPDTLGSPGNSPWTMTVGASTSNRHFFSTVTLTGDQIANPGTPGTKTLMGTTVTSGIITPTRVVNAADYDDARCLAPFAPNTFDGEVVICERGTNARVEKGYNVMQGGAGGMILYNPTIQSQDTDNHYIPTVHLQNDHGAQLLAFTAAYTNVMVTFTGGVATEIQGDTMASFSSRGGPGNTRGISRPDITAPGVQILAGNSPLPAEITGGPSGQLFQSIPGTSMSSPHIAGSGALLKALHPDWTPGRIKSAIMTTAKNQGVTKEDGETPADAFDMGAGRVDLSKAGDPGLVFDVSFLDYVKYKDHLWDANYPSLYFPAMPGRMSVVRTAQSLLPAASEWAITVDAPEDVEITLPATLAVPAMGEAIFEITVDARDVPVGEIRFATIYLTYNNYKLHIPVTLVRQDALVAMQKDCTQAAGRTTEAGDVYGFGCVITMTNTSYNDISVGMEDVVTNGLTLVSGSVTGANELDGKVVFLDTLSGAMPPAINVSIEPLSSPAGYLPLAGFGGSEEIGGMADETIANYNVPAFTYAGETYNRIGITSNGYIIVGGGTAAEVEFDNSQLPNPSLPNNILAPFWSDLNLEDGGTILINTLCASPSLCWIVVEYEDVPYYGTDRGNTFQAWIGYGGADGAIFFTYGDVDITPDDYLTVGAEDKTGQSGGVVYYNGEGDAPEPSEEGYEVLVEAGAPTPGETRVVSLTAEGNPGKWQNCAVMESDAFYGASIACDSGMAGTPVFLPVVLKE